MSAIINSSLTVPVTYDQVNAFKTWARETYATYAAYNAESSRSDNPIYLYIRSNILTPEMNTVLIESEPFVRTRLNDSHVKELKMNRKRVNDKIRYMKTKLGKLAFKEEAEQLRLEAAYRAFAPIFLEQLRQERQRLGLPERRLPVSYKITKISKLDAQLPMLDDCCICMEKHQLNSVIEGPCGHKLGKTCFKEWVTKCKHTVTCPLCRVTCNEVLEIVSE